MVSAMGNPEEGSENFPRTDDRQTGLLGEVTVMRGKNLPGRCSSREMKQRCGQHRLTGQQGRVSPCPLQPYSPQRCQGLRGQEWGGLPRARHATAESCKIQPSPESAPRPPCTLASYFVTSSSCALAAGLGQSRGTGQKPNFTNIAVSCV